MLDLMAEQMDDLEWASRVVRGEGDDGDNQCAACRMLKTLSVSGVTKEIRNSAEVALNKKATVAV